MSNLKLIKLKTKLSKTNINDIIYFFERDENTDVIFNKEMFLDLVKNKDAWFDISSLLDDEFEDVINIKPFYDIDTIIKIFSVLKDKEIVFDCVDLGKKQPYYQISIKNNKMKEKFPTLNYE